MTHTTMRFDFDIRKFKGNPHLAETPFGKASIICSGDLFEIRNENDQMRDSAPDMLEALELVLDGLIKSQAHPHLHIEEIKYAIATQKHIAKAKGQA
jgi:hypothetical protein